MSNFGLGYAGSVSLARLSRDGHHVTGVDIDETKLALPRGGKSPTVESGIMELINSVVASGRVNVTNSAKKAVRDTALSVVCVGTPSLSTGDQDLAEVLGLCKQIGLALKSKQSQHTVVFRSIVQPGTVENKLIPVLEKHSGKQSGNGFVVCFQPEFHREGSSIRDYDNPPMTVMGSEHSIAIEQLRELFGSLPCDFIKTDIRTAETLKYACTTFHALDVLFVNGMGRIFQYLGADSHRVTDFLYEDRQLNISRAYLQPGFAFGGSCLPKNIRGLVYMSKRDDVDVPILSALLPSNRTDLVGIPERENLKARSEGLCW